MHAASLLLRYSHGNQIYASELTIYVDGTGELLERATPVEVERHALPPLSDDELARLTASIEAAARGDLQLSAGALTSLGSTTTDLLVYQDEVPTIITRIGRDNDGDGRDQVVQNLAEEAEALRALVDGYVRHDVPR